MGPVRKAGYPSVLQSRDPLLELEQRLRENASLSHKLKSRHWQKLEKIGNRISHDREELANDYSDKSVRFVSDAAHALAEFAKEAAS